MSKVDTLSFFGATEGYDHIRLLLGMLPEALISTLDIVSFTALLGAARTSWERASWLQRSPLSAVLCKFLSNESMESTL